MSKLPSTPTDVSRPERARAVAKARESVQSVASVVQRREERRLARLVEHARHRRAEVEGRAQAVEGGSGVPGDQHGVGAHGRFPCVGGQVMAGAGQRLGVERGMELLDDEAVLAAESGERPARGGGHLGPDAVAGEARDDVSASDCHLGCLGGKGVDTGSSSRSVRPVDAPLVWSLSACAPGERRVSEDLP